MSWSPSSVIWINFWCITRLIELLNSILTNIQFSNLTLIMVWLSQITSSLSYDKNLNEYMIISCQKFYLQVFSSIEIVKKFRPWWPLSNYLSDFYSCCILLNKFHHLSQVDPFPLKDLLGRRYPHNLQFLIKSSYPKWFFHYCSAAIFFLSSYLTLSDQPFSLVN